VEILEFFYGWNEGLLVGGTGNDGIGKDDAFFGNALYIVCVGISIALKIAALV